MYKGRTVLLLLHVFLLVLDSIAESYLKVYRDEIQSK